MINRVVVTAAIFLIIVQLQTAGKLSDGGSEATTGRKEGGDQSKNRKRDVSAPTQLRPHTSAAAHDVTVAPPPDVTVAPPPDVTWRVERPDPRLARNRTRAKTGREQLRAFFADRAREDAYQKTEAREHPYSVVFLSYAEGNKVEVCSGSLVSDRWVLTAAHCLVDSKPYRIDVFAGLAIDIFTELPQTLPPGSQHRQSREFVAHPGYDPAAPNVDFDLALVKIDPGFRVTEFVRPVELAASAWDRAGPAACSLTAFGTVRDGRGSADDFVRKTQEMLVEKPCFCDAKLRRSLGKGATSRYICMRPRQDFGICTGDSGGGLVCGGRLAAVVSISFSLVDFYPCEPIARQGNRSFPYRRPVGHANRRTRSDGGPACGDRDTMSVFQDVFPSLEWIQGAAVRFEDSPSGAAGARGRGLHPLGAALVGVCVVLMRRCE